jgi:hypothetical protein
MACVTRAVAKKSNDLDVPCLRPPMQPFSPRVHAG